jgi:hypothetical protein
MNAYFPRLPLNQQTTFNLEDGGTMFLRDIDIRLQN